MASSDCQLAGDLGLAVLLDVDHVEVGGRQKLGGLVGAPVVVRA